MKAWSEKPECDECGSLNVSLTYKEIPHPTKYNLTGGFICLCKKCGNAWTMYKKGEGPQDAKV